MMRFSCPLVCLGLLSLAGAAQAQDSTGPVIMELRLPDGDGDYSLGSPREVRIYFNRAKCECSAPFQIRYRFDEDQMPGDLENEQVDIFFGADCTDRQARNECLETDNGIARYANIRMSVEREYNVRDFVTLGEEGECPQTDRANTVFALVDPEGDGEFESTSTRQISYDTRAPSLPDNIELSGGEEALQVSFDRSRDDEDLIEYQILCAPVDSPDTPVLEAGDRPEAGYDRAADIEGCASDFALPFEGDSDEVPTGLRDLDPAFLCGSGPSSASSVRTEALENGVAYHAVLMTVDRNRNARAVYLGTAEPRPAVDFWELYEDEGGAAEGGLGCQSGGGAGSGLALVLALGLGAAILRRRRGMAILLVPVLGSLAVSAPAAAQPYWEELEEPVTEVGVSRPAWTFGIKLGPYTADIDSEFSGSGPGPFERTFGSKAGLMTQLELDRYFVYPFGQLGVSLMAGYHSKSGGAFTMDSDGGLRRSDTENTGFNLLPLALSAVYRVTAMDDHLRVPLVPYARLGLAYYVWWITAPDGDVAETDSGGKGRGASLGWQGSLGLAVRLERLDANASRSLRNEFGVDHAGIYAEVNLAQVDGFGSDSRLSVGDLTWFGGVNFEF